MKFDGTNWVNIGTAGFSAGVTNYTSLAFSPSGYPYVAYNDWPNAFKVTVKYYNGPTGINEPEHSQLSFYPNPAIDRITVEISGTAKGCNLSIVNIEGQELIPRQISEPKTEIDISNLPSGVYFVRLTNDRMVEVGKIIKQ